MTDSDKNISIALEQYGFTQNQTKIYLFLLETVESTVFTIAKETNVPRTTAYATLEQMKSKGIVSSFKKGSTLYFTPASPSKLIQLLKQRQEVLQEILPELQAMIDTSEVKPGVRIYEGIEGLKLVYEDILETLQNHNIKMLYAAAHPEIFQFLPKYFPDWLERRVAAGIQTQLIMPMDTSNQEVFEDNQNREIRYMPADYPFQCSMDIYADKIAFFSFKGNKIYSIVIESGTITNLWKQFFRFTWNRLPKLTPLNK